MATPVGRSVADDAPSTVDETLRTRPSSATGDGAQDPSRDDIHEDSKNSKTAGSGANQVLNKDTSNADTASPAVQPTTSAAEDEKHDLLNSDTSPPPPEESQTPDLSALWFIAILFFAGVCLIIAHGLFYNSRNGMIVPTSQKKQAFYLGVGNACALVVTTCFAIAVRFAWTQAVWATLRKSGLSLGAFDVAFNVPKPMQSSLRALWELICLTGFDFGIRVLTWSLQLIQVFTPSSLTVYGTFDTRIAPSLVPSLAISDPTEAYRFAYFQSTNITTPGANPGSYTYQGARTILTRIATATASFGQILSLPPPSTQSTYSLDFFAPYILCDDANATTANAIEAFVLSWDVGANNVSFVDLLSFYAFVPSFDAPSAGSNTITVSGKLMTALDQPRPENTPRNATNELWMKFFRYETNGDGTYVLTSNGSRVPVPTYTVCTLWNASMSVEFSFINGYQTISLNSVNATQQIPYPSSDPSETSNLVEQAYTSWFQVITDQVVGSMGLTIQNGTAGPSNYSFFETQLEHTSLLGSNDLDFVFDQNRVTQGLPLANITVPRQLSDQRLQDKALARNRTLDVLIEELGFNLTISLMTDPLLAPSILTQVVHTTPVNRYTFRTRQLLATYLAFTLCVAVASCRGIDLAARINKAVHDMDASSIISAVVGDDKLRFIYPERYLGLPAHRSSIAMLSKVLFSKERSVWSLRPHPRRVGNADGDHDVAE